MEKQKKELGYSNALTLIMTFIAASVGTGNLWRFPRVAAANGGAFVVAYLILMFVIIIPIMIGEHVMGRATRHGVPGAYRDFAGKKYTWLGMIIIGTMMMTASYYSAVLGWVLRYLVLSVTKGYYGQDKVEFFNNMTHANVGTVVCFFIVLLATAYIAYSGVGFIEKVNKVMVPVLFAALIITAIRSLTSPGALTGLNYYLSFKGSDFLNGKIWLEALTQCIWSAGPGFGLCITTAVFTKPKTDVALTSTINGMGDAFAALVAGLAVIPAIFAFNSPEQALEIANSGNNGLTFIAMTTVFEEMPGGYIIGILFFIALLFAGMSSNVIHYLICSLPFADSGKDKKKVVIGLTILLMVWGLPSAWNPTFLSNQDWVAGNMMMMGAMFSCFILMKHGVSKVRKEFINTPYTGLKIGKWWEFSIKYIGPISAAIMFIWWTIQSFGWGEKWWNPFGINNLGTFLFQGAIMGIICFVFNDKCADSIKHKYFDGHNYPDVPDNGYAG